jgi:hypothetical protein
VFIASLPTIVFVVIDPAPTPTFTLLKVASVLPTKVPPVKAPPENPVPAVKTVPETVPPTKVPPVNALPENPEPTTVPDVYVVPEINVFPVVTTSPKFVITGFIGVAILFKTYKHYILNGTTQSFYRNSLA